MLQAALLVIHVASSFLAILILFIASIYLLVAARDAGKQKYVTPAVLTMSIAIFVLLGLNYCHFVVDDVYISLRYARNLANGYGLVFNTDGSQPVEGYTNFLWVLMESVLFKFNLSDETILEVIRIIGLVFGVGVVLATYYLMRVVEFGERISLTAVLFLCMVPQFAFWAVGGLETTMYMFWLMLALCRYIYERKMQKIHLWSMVILFLLALTRPEGLFIAFALMLFHLLENWVNRDANHAKSIRNILPGIFTFLVLYGVYFAWRFDTYGYPFPNTFYAKKITYFGQFIHRTKQISNFVGPLLPFFAVACIGFFQFNKKFRYEKIILMLMLFTLITFCYLARTEWMPGHRYELPFMPLLIIFFAAGLGRISFSDIRNFGIGRFTNVVPFVVLLLFGSSLMSRFNEIRKNGNEFAKQLNRAHVPLGKWLRLHAPENASYASWDMGAVPYYSGLPTIIDINLEGLLNSYTTHHGYDIDRLLSQKPSFLVLPPNTTYVRPRDILEFYNNPRLKKEYEYLFSVSFNRDYILHVYKHKEVMLTEMAVKEANNMAEESRRDLLY